MEIFTQTNVDFMRLRKGAVALSLFLIVVALGSLLVRGLNFGIDFTGGTLLEVSYEQPAELSSIRSTLEEAGYEGAVVQHVGTSRDVLIRLAPREGISTAQLSEKVMVALRASDEQLQMRRQEFVGPQVGDELVERGGLALLYALLGILVYVALRFEKRFAVGSVAALVHDVILTLGFFSVLQLEFDLTILAAILAVIGYSLNDTIVVFDRIRENFRKMRKGSSADVVNASLNQTLSRTVLTSGTTALVLLALFFLGGELIHGFATALLVGVVVGTYSSIYIASPVLLALGVSREDLLPVEKEGVEQEEPLP
ncbi:protein translocase subunit SecF [Thiohalomonas denitrificans]|uniref:Protein-export membrane protein SecF n=1 Tax=Thiohalomonas denitrificans TaxID=415747 RepID=A0A1G5Q272_9GAMM|nr:protein translocase subunit SecF [Thiohalomonas denitrificans]SCZ55409.1 preprotein translocase subunit SecF [Thiohalomonas denitrificans]